MRNVLKTVGLLKHIFLTYQFYSAKKDNILIIDDIT